jgi:micrococcal nuclease
MKALVLALCMLAGSHIVCHASEPATVAHPTWGASWAVAPSSLKCVDGDTCRHGSSTWRLFGIDAPELHQGCAEERVLGLKAKQALASMLASAKHVRVSLAKQRDKYGRRLAKVYANGQDVAQALVAQGLARPYTGGARQGWCG